MAVNWKKIIGLEGPDRGPGSTGLGPDFPDSAGMRELGKFRESAYARLTAVAVVDDDGNSIGSALVPNFEDLAMEIRKLRFALTVKGVAEDLGDLNF